MFALVLRKRNPIYARALIEGQVLRQLVEWLNFVWSGLCVAICQVYLLFFLTGGLALIPKGALGGRSAREIGCFRVANSIYILDWLTLSLLIILFKKCVHQLDR